ncbi:MAG: hypothetical protein WA871_12760 [Candidatus Acidiferrales bacterium]
MAPAPKEKSDRVSRAWQWGEYILAILAGNIIYLSIEPKLPIALRHHLYRADLGVLFDFFICVGMYGLVRLARRI